MRRRRAKRGLDKRIFSKTASNTNRKNLMASPMRGGFRL